MREISVRDILLRLKDAIRKKGPEKVENQQFVSPLRQCCSTTVGFGQGFLNKEKCDNTGTSPILSLPCSS